jgi:hypothetical protein
MSAEGAEELLILLMYMTGLFGPLAIAAMVADWWERRERTRQTKWWCE